ncbi:MAG: DUF4142 domain-containing protein [Gemmatimonadaceae bacterium]
MLYRRTLLCLALSFAASCQLFRPIPESPEPSASPAPARAERPAPSAPSTPSTQAPRVRGTGSVSDANIAAMVLASNNTDISYARLVPSRAQRDDVKEFGQRMLTDHVGVNSLVTELLRKLDLAAEDNTASLDMRDESANRRDAMRDLSGFAFDSAYMTNEVSYHQKFLASIDNVMLPSARNADLRALLMSVRPAVAAHLAHAELVWANVMAKK